MNLPEAVTTPADRVLTTGHDRQPPSSLEDEGPWLGGMLLATVAVARSEQGANDSVLY